MSARDECGNCRFWAKRDDHAEGVGGGYCRRFPPFAPSAWLIRTARGIGDGIPADMCPSDKYLNDAWPMVHQQSWCGEFDAIRALDGAENG